MNWTKFIVLGFYDGQNYFEFKKLSKFVDHLKQQKKSLEIFAHFGGKFDFLFLIQEFLKYEDIIFNTIVPRGSSILYFSVSIGSLDYTFRDSSALLPFSLKSITENFNVETKKGEWDHSKTKGYSKALGEYLKSDCIGLYQSLEKFFNWPLIKKAGSATTLASQSMRVFRTYLDQDIYALAKSTSDFCRNAYLGGRTEIFKPLCEKKIYEYDVNSLYPYVMSNNIFPTNKAITTFRYIKGHLGIYHCNVTVPEKEYLPCLGVIHEKKYVFPRGKFCGYFTTAEIDYALSLGYKIKIGQGVYFRESRFLFKNFIDDLYNIRLRSEKNSVSDIIAKLLMNSSYGRFGMNVSKENMTFTLKEGVKDYAMIKLNDKNIELYKEPIELETFTHVAIAAFVTSYARIHMHKLMYPIKEYVYYTDTDSIFTTKKLPSGKALGELKLEHVYDSACFLLPKTYIAKSKTKTKIAMKGFDKRKLSQFTYDDFKAALEGDIKRMKITSEPKFATFKSALAKKELVTMTKASEKQLRSRYDKREIIKIKNKYDSIPLSLNTEEVE